MPYTFDRQGIEAEFYMALREVVAETTLTLNTTIQRSLSIRGSTRAKGNIPAPRGRPPATQTGALRRSWQSDMSDINNLRTAVGSRLKYASIHEFGGRISIPEVKPKRGKALRWLDSAGKPVFVRRTRARTVTMPARPYVRPSIRVVEQRRLPEIIQRRISHAVRRING